MTRPRTARSHRSIGIELGTTLGDRSVGGGQNDITRRLLTSSRNRNGVGTETFGEFSGVLTVDAGGGFAWSDLIGCSEYESEPPPALVPPQGRWVVDSTFEMLGGTSGDSCSCSCRGFPYSGNFPGGTIRWNLSGAGETNSCTWKGQAGPGSPVAVGATINGVPATSYIVKVEGWLWPS